MAPLRTLVLPAFAAVAAAQSIADYVPECGTSCIDTTVDENTTCEAGDAACICENAYSVKRNAEVCLRDECSESDYGLVMTGYDEFCNEAGNSPEPSPSETNTYDTTVPPTTTSTSDEGYPTNPPPETTSSEEGYPTEPPVSSGYPSSEVPSEYPTLSTSVIPSSNIETFPSYTDQPPPTTSGEPEYPTDTPPEPTDEPEYPTEAPPEPTDEPEYPTEAPPEPTEEPTQPTEAPQPPPESDTGYPTQEPPTPTEEPSITPIPTAGARANFQLSSGAFVAAGMFAAGLAIFGF